MLVDPDGKLIARPVLVPQSKSGRQELEIHNDCDGTPDCAVELRITQREKGPGNNDRYIEVHMTDTETRFLEKWLKAAREKRSPQVLPFPGGLVVNAGPQIILALPVEALSHARPFSASDAKEESKPEALSLTANKVLMFTLVYERQILATFDEEALYLLHRYGGLSDLLGMVTPYFPKIGTFDLEKLQILMKWM